MKMIRLVAIAGLTAASGFALWRAAPAVQDYATTHRLTASLAPAPPDPKGVTLTGQVPPLTELTTTPRARFRPTTRRGYWNIDVVGDFELPKTKSLTFSAAGRNLHVRQDWSKLFRRGFSSIDRTRMVPDEYQDDRGRRHAGWRSRLSFSQRALSIGRNYFTDNAFRLNWAQDSKYAPDTWYRRPPGDPNFRNSMYSAAAELRGGCVAFNDCPPNGMLSTYSKIFLDIENEGALPQHQQEQANLYTYMIWTMKQITDPRTEIGSIGPIPLNGFGYSRAREYAVDAPEWLWTMPARHTATSRRRGMPDEIVGKSFGELIDLQMPHSYFFWPDFDYNASHTGDADRHWLAATLHEQEVNARVSPKKRVAWQWLFNTQSPAFPNSQKAMHPAPPAVAEGLAVFYWFTGAYGAILWDDHNDLLPDQPRPADPNVQDIGNDRVYACYEHYLHGLWRLFRHHGDLFDGRERYLNQLTECSYDGGRTWFRYNANQLKTKDLPFVRALVNGDQILVAASKPYARPNQTTRVMLRYVENGYQFYTDLTLRGDEIYLGRATMPRPNSGRATPGRATMGRGMVGRAAGRYDAGQ